MRRKNGGFGEIPSSSVKAVAPIVSAKGIYIILNVVNPDLLARAANRIRPVKQGESTSDKDILRRRWLKIDLDAERPAGISATDAEHAAAIERAKIVREYLTVQGWPQPHRNFSGIPRGRETAPPKSGPPIARA